MTNDIRPYGPGKFNTIIDSYVYELSLNGPDDSAGDVQENGHCYSLMRGSFKLSGSFADLTVDKINGLTAGERQLLTTTAGVIIAENDQGFVSVDYFDSPAALQVAWDALQTEVEAAYDEEDSTDDDDEQE